jgi:hypothetical protein
MTYKLTEEEIYQVNGSINSGFEKIAEAQIAKTKQEMLSRIDGLKEEIAEHLYCHQTMVSEKGFHSMGNCRKLAGQLISKIKEVIGK